MDDYPLLNLVLTMLWLYIIVAWFWPDLDPEEEAELHARFTAGKDY